MHLWVQILTALLLTQCGLLLWSCAEWQRARHEGS
jgi:hypothetical protein